MAKLPLCPASSLDKFGTVPDNGWQWHLADEGVAPRPVRHCVQTLRRRLAKKSEGWEHQLIAQGYFALLPTLHGDSGLSRELGDSQLGKLFNETLPPSAIGTQWPGKEPSVPTFPRDQREGRSLL